MGLWRTQEVVDGLEPVLGAETPDVALFLKGTSLLMRMGRVRKRSIGATLKGWSVLSL